MNKKLSLIGKIFRSESVISNFLTLYSRLRGGRFEAKKIGPGKWKIHDGSTSLYVHTPFRFLNYRLGIDRRLDTLVKSYGYPNFFDIDHGDVIIDVGANIGEFSIFCMGKGAIVHAFEPDSNIFPLLNLNLKEFANIPGNFSLEQSALGQISKKVTFFENSIEADSSLVKPDNSCDYVEKTVQCVRLDDYVISREIKSVKLVKCDAEGGEPEVVYGAEKILNRIHMFCIDCSPERNGQPTYLQVSNFLRDHNFEIVNEPKYTYRNLVFAKNRGLL